ncbi:MAG: hypothetical protein HQ518_29540 [Rhodopirellula sp.]|nr:hypothetical protein [Rhodopirellula sp.]
MKRILKLSSVGLALAMALTTVTQAQEQEQPQGRNGAGRERSAQQGQGQGRPRGGDQGGRGQRGGRFPGGGFPGGGFSGGGRGPGGGIDKLTLIAAKPIQEELKLGEDELFFVSKLTEDFRTDSRELFTGIDFRSLSEEDRRTKFEELGKKRAELVKVSEKGLAEFLSEAQSKRLDEIALQLMGIRALTNDDVAQKLKLTSDQKKGVEDALKAADEDRQKMFEELRTAGGGAGGFEGMREKMEEARKKSDEKALAVLSVDQKKQFEELKGKPFEVDRRALFSFGGRGGTQGGGGRPGGAGGRRPGGDAGGRPQRPATE